MISITKDRNVITLINIFTVSPEKQAKLVGLLTQATDSAVRQVPGFISASLHRGLDGTKVVMYAQWRSIEDYEAMRKNAAASPFLQQALEIATFAPGMYEVVDTFVAPHQTA
jgi:heme-degrading monooxygenase HmoA